MSSFLDRINNKLETEEKAKKENIVKKQNDYKMALERYSKISLDVDSLINNIKLLYGRDVLMVENDNNCILEKHSSERWHEHILSNGISHHFGAMKSLNRHRGEIIALGWYAGGWDGDWDVYGNGNGIWLQHHDTHIQQPCQDPAIINRFCDSFPRYKELFGKWFDKHYPDINIQKNNVKPKNSIYDDEKLSELVDSGVWDWHTSKINDGDTFDFSFSVHYGNTMFAGTVKDSQVFEYDIWPSIGSNTDVIDISGKTYDELSGMIADKLTAEHNGRAKLSADVVQDKEAFKKAVTQEFLNKGIIDIDAAPQYANLAATADNFYLQTERLREAEERSRMKLLAKSKRNKSNELTL